MSTWQVEDRLETDLEDLGEVVVRIVGGEVAVTVAEGASRLEVVHRSGPPVQVRFDAGVLRVTHASEGEALLDKLLGFLSSSDRRHECAVAVTVPAATKVDVATVSADALAAGLSSRTAVKTVSGDITLADLSGRVEAASVSGDVSGRGVSADISLSSVSGSFSIVDGGSHRLTAKTVSGDLVFDVSAAPGASYEVSTVSGDVVFRTPPEPSLTVEMTSMSGQLRSDFGAPSEDTRPGRRRAHHLIGEGEARLTVKSLSGDVRLVARRDAA